eukprot:1115357-Pelagomonas_calceolata.AAC.1
MYQKVTGYPLIVPILPRHCVPTNTWKKKFPSFPHDTHSCSHKCPQVRTAFLPADHKETFTRRIKDSREITYTDGGVIKHEDDNSPPLSGLSVNKPGRDISPPSQHLQLHVKPNGHGPTNTITRAELV